MCPEVCYNRQLCEKIEILFVVFVNLELITAWSAPTVTGLCGSPITSVSCGSVFLQLVNSALIRTAVIWGSKIGNCICSEDPRICSRFFKGGYKFLGKVLRERSQSKASCIWCIFNKLGVCAHGVFGPTQCNYPRRLLIGHSFLSSLVLIGQT